MKNTVWSAILLAQVLLFSEAHAYKEPTHQIMSQEALRRSEAGKQSELYGLLDISFADAVSQTGRGAFDEDGGTRPFNHFYNPISGQGSPIGTPSPDYILEGESSCLLHSAIYSFAEAQHCYLLALTGANPLARKQDARTMFINLGHVLHHIQDMAQPQHTRSDEHCDSLLLCYFFKKSPGVSRYDPSLYEVHSEKWQSEIVSMKIPETVFSKTMKNAQFNHPRDFWKNSNNPGMGMAEFSNSNFTTKWTNFTFCKDNERGYCDTNLISTLRLPSPNLTNTSDSVVSKSGAATPITVPTGVPGINITITPNRYVVNKLGVPMGTTSLIYSTGDNLFQDDNVYRGYFNTLIPKALAYSAGMINFYFRGDVNASLSDKGTVVVANPSQFDMNGKFDLYSDAAGGTRSSTGFSWSGKLAAGQSFDTGIAGPDLSTAVPKNQGILVFDGAIGTVPRQIAGRKVTLVKTSTPTPTTPTPVATAPNSGGGVSVALNGALECSSQTATSVTYGGFGGHKLTSCSIIPTAVFSCSGGCFNADGGVRYFITGSTFDGYFYRSGPGLSDGRLCASLNHSELGNNYAIAARIDPKTGLLSIPLILASSQVDESIGFNPHPPECDVYYNDVTVRFIVTDLATGEKSNLSLSYSSKQ